MNSLGGCEKAASTEGIDSNVAPGTSFTAFVLNEQFSGVMFKE